MLEKDALVRNRYRIGRCLGEGGMGAVHEAIDEHTGEFVALKVIRSERIEHQARPQAIKRFERECRAIGALATPHIVRMIDAGHDEERKIPYLVMELLRGKDLKQLLDEHGPLPPALVVRIAAQAARGLMAAHAIGLVHRDIKPANIFVGDAVPPGDLENELVVRVLDFGVSKFQPGAPNAENTSVSIDGGMIGSPAYMSPEQARGENDIDERTDVWSLGVVMYEALSGRLPFGEKLPLGQVILSICAEPARNIGDAAPWVPDAICDVVHRAIAKSRVERYSTAEAFYQALLAIDGAAEADLRIDQTMVRGVSEAEAASQRLPNTFRTSGADDSGRHTATDVPRSVSARTEMDSIRPVASDDSGTSQTRAPGGSRWVAAVVAAASLAGAFWFANDRAAVSAAGRELAMKEHANVGAATAAARSETALVVDVTATERPGLNVAKAASKVSQPARKDGAKRTVPSTKDDVYAP